jgi:subtilisin-like proprotein convertase family protein
VKKSAYPNGAPPELPRTSEILVLLLPGKDPETFARDLGLKPVYALASNPNAWVFLAPNPDLAAAARVRATADPRVELATLNRRIQLEKHYIPNDPYAANNNPAGFPGQWYLGLPGGASATHANVAAAWARNLTGTGVIIGIVDDGMEFTHPDLAGNFVATDSLNFSTPPNSNYGPDPTVDGTSTEDRHGTSVAGIAGAVGGNGIGISGVAPSVGLAINRINYLTLTDSQLADAISYHSIGGINTLKIKNHSYGAGVSYYDFTFEANAVTASANLGTINVYSAGNGRLGITADSNKLMPQNNPDVITVAAIGSDGFYSYYSSFGSNVFVTAPSSSASGFGVTTTDRSGALGYNPTAPDSFPDTDYTSVFGGTSAAAPLVSGIMALGRQANPKLDVRMAQHALVRTSNRVDSMDSTVTGGGNGASGSAWKKNDANFYFNENYGFGMIDADLFTQRLLLYSGVSPLQTESVTVYLAGGNGVTIPDNSPAGVQQTFHLNSTTPLESVTVLLRITHPYKGDVEAVLTSPKGTSSRLLYRAGDGGAFPTQPWACTSHAFWGENPQGDWQLTVSDVQAADQGTWYYFIVNTRMGRPTLAGTVLDGISGPDLSSQTSTTTMSAHWTGFNDPTITIASYAWAIGNSPGAANVLPFTDVGLQTSATTDSSTTTLSLSPGSTYYVTVRATDDAGIISTASSDGVVILGPVSAPLPPVLHALAQPSSVLLQWTPSPSASLSFYRLWWKPTSASWMTATLVDNLVGTTTTVTGLTNGTSYDFMLRAVSATGDESPGSIASAVPGNLITMNGSGNYASIQLAITAAAAVGGTVNIEAGTYTENLSLPGGVTLVGASPNATIIRSPTVGTDAITATGTYLTNPLSTVSNLGVTFGRNGINAASADLLVQNVVVHHMSLHGIVGGLASRLQVINCTLMHNGGDGLQGLGLTVVRNAISGNNVGFGINVPPGSLVTYSSAYGNSPGNDFSGAITLTTDGNTAPTFTNEAGNDYTEVFGSASVDAGDPLDAFAAELYYNGGRINQGAFGNTPWAGPSPLPSAPGGCGLSGIEGLLALATVAWGRRRVARRDRKKQ